jgi:glycosyltransferase involved in cell wall biosynthesis
MKDRRFFVVTPVLNGAKYMAQTLASIDAQTFPGWTHYVVDGGSSDGTVELVQASMKNEPRRHLIQGRDRGLYDAVFKGFEAIEADGLRDDDICLWLNADDLLAPWAFATMHLAFDHYQADWVTAQRGQWDAEGRLVLLRPFGWYPRWCLRKGWFNERCLGSIQQESTFFTARLLRRLPQDAIAAIRALHIVGDFFLWRQFAQFAPLYAAPTLIGGFRLHGANLSMGSVERNMAELRAIRAFLPPAGLGRALRFLYLVLATLTAGIKARHALSPPEDTDLTTR